MDASQPGVSVIVPTWREAANLAPLVERVSAVMSRRPGRWEVVFVDDDSQDGSEGIVADLARRHPARLVSRREGPRDLSLAVREGVRRSRYDRIVVMDADLSHPPESLPALLSALDRGACDLVVGSRYAPGGRVASDWSRWRLLASRLAARLAQPLAPVSDPLSGFLAADRRALPDLGPPRPLGYKIGLEWIARGRLRVEEVPIDFADRRRGASKMTWRQQAAYLSQLGRLYLQPPGRAALLHSGSRAAGGFLVDLAGYLGLLAVGLEHRLARLLSLGPALASRWFAGVRAARRRDSAAPRPAAGSRLGPGVGAGVSFGAYWALTTFVEPFADRRLLAFVSGAALGGLAGFLSDLLLANPPRRRPRPVAPR